MSQPDANLFHGGDPPRRDLSAQEVVFAVSKEASAVASVCVDVINPQMNTLPLHGEGQAERHGSRLVFSVEEEVNPSSWESAGPSAPLSRNQDLGGHVMEAVGWGAAAGAAWGTGVCAGTFLAPHLTVHGSRPASARLRPDGS